MEAQDRAAPEPVSGASLGHRRIFSLTYQVRYGTVLLVTLSVLLTGGLIIYLSYRSQDQQLQHMLAARSEAAATSLTAYMDDLQRKLSYLARVRGLVEFPAATQQALLEGLARHNDAYELLAILDSRGHVTAFASPFGQELPQTVAQSPAFQTAFERHEEYVGSVEVLPVSGPQQQIVVVTVAVPIRDQQDQVAGVLLARINLRFLWFVVGNVNLSSGYAYIVDNRHVLVARTGTSPETFQPEQIAERPMIQQLLSGTLTPGSSYTGLTGVEVLGAHNAVPSMGWKVVIELPTAEAYAPIRSMLTLTGALLAGAVLFALLVGLLFARQIVNPLQRLTAAAAQLSAGQMDVQVPIAGRNELSILAASFNGMAAQLRSLIERLQREQHFVSGVLDTAGALVIVQDAAGRVVRFNRASEQLTGLSFEQVKDRHLWELFQTPEAIERARAIVQQLSGGEQQAIDDESSWVSSDAQRRLLAWSHTALRDAAGSVEYIVSSAVDVTEVRQAEEERTRMQEQIIRAQAETLSQLSTPLIPITDEVVIVPLIGALDAQRAEQLLAVLLHGVEQQRARIAIIDITGVPGVDTQVAGILLRAAQAVRLLGAEIAITGIGPEIAQTLVTLGADLRGIRTAGTLQSGIAYALSRNAARRSPGSSQQAFAGGPAGMADNGTGSSHNGRRLDAERASAAGANGHGPARTSQLLVPEEHG